MKRIFILTIIFLLIACSARFTKRPKLDPEGEEFLSSVRYIITPEEEREFVNLPLEKRKEYMEEFWKRRGEGFKEEYFKRIEYSNKFFSTGGRVGWLTDRGMVYILYGPPTQLERYPMGSGSYPYAHEIWYYEYVQIVFYDPYNTGDYRLTPESLMALDTIRMIPTAQVLPMKKFKEKKAVHLKIELEVEKVENGVKLKISIPYENISLIEKEGKLETELEVVITISGKEPIRKSESYKLSFTKEEIEKLTDRYFKIEIPLTLKKGKFKGNVTITNKLSKDKATKKFDFTL
ncbi:MAG: GWxTD domain-containing protein [Candidatus Aminicenantia bacterium]